MMNLLNKEIDFPINENLHKDDYLHFDLQNRMF